MPAVAVKALDSARIRHILVRVAYMVVQPVEHVEHGITGAHAPANAVRHMLTARHVEGTTCWSLQGPSREASWLMLLVTWRPMFCSFTIGAL